VKQIELNGIKLFVRDEQPHWDDLHVVNEVITEDCYRIDPGWFKGNTIIDIGANIGAFCLQVWKYGRTIAFEPEPHNFELLQMNVALNKADVELHNQAVGKPGHTLIDDGSGHSQTNRLVGNEVGVVSLDSVKLDKCDLLKCDCEGGEYDIVQYTSDKTWKKIDRIIGEFHSWYWEADPERHKRMIKRLERFFKLSYYGFKNSNFVGVRK
jgi:FkbM family methyltransferase